MGKDRVKEWCVKNAKKRHLIKKVLLTFIAASFAISFLLPTILTMANSFMSSAEISTNYGVIFNKYKQLDYGEKDTDYVAEKVNLKLIPDMVDFSQYSTVLLKSPEYLLKFWNSVILVIPIMIFQILVALGASYSFMRFRSKRREVLFFMYVAVMLMPFQVTLVPNYIVADWLHILDTRWSIILPGIFAPFSVYLLTKFMRRIPASLIEAAQLDGANEWQIFTKVCIPLCKGPIASVAILAALILVAIPPVPNLLPAPPVILSISGVISSTRVSKTAFLSLCGSAVKSPSMSDKSISKSAFIAVATIAPSVSLSPITISSVAMESFSLIIGIAPSSNNLHIVFSKLTLRTLCSMSPPVIRICATVWLYSENSLSYVYISSH